MKEEAYLINVEHDEGKKWHFNRKKDTKGRESESKRQ